MHLSEGYTSTFDRVNDDTDGPPRTPPRSRTTCTTAPTAPEGALDCRAEKLKKSVKTVMGNDAPFNADSQDIEMTRFDPLVNESRKILKKELKPMIELNDESGELFASSLYPHVAKAEKVREFLKDTEVYNWKKKRWDLPPTDEKLEELMMYPPLVRLLNEIFRWFWGEEATDREAVDTHITLLFHKEPVCTDNHTSPDISVKARGSSFQLPDGGDATSIGYSNIAAFFEAKITTQGWSPMQELLQLAVYARQLFIQQSNRRFVRTLIITEQSFRLFHFDRSGVQYTQEMDIHKLKYAEVFVRLVLGLCSVKEESDIGLDDSVEWKVVNGRKFSGTLKTRDENDVEIIYPLADVKPTVLSYEICGRGITSWRVVDPTSGEILLVRDMWRSKSRLPEDFYLEKAKGKSGIVQMISFEYNREETAQFRNYGNSPHPLFPVHRNRIATRIVLDSHGKSIKNFKSPKELLMALRDAIAGHRELYEKAEALHRQVTLDNVMLGRPGALAGNRGILIGLDLAKGQDSDASVEWHSPSEIYRSITVLRRGKSFPYPLPHSHLDDLESFVYVLTHVMFNYDHTGTPRKSLNLTQKWSLMSNSNEASNKESYLSQIYFDLTSDIHRTWPPSCTKLLLAYKTWLFGLNSRKMELANRKPKVRERALTELMLQVWEHYETVLGFFDTAIGAIESGNDVIPPPTPDSVASGSASASPVSGEALSSPLALVREASLVSPFASSEGDVSEVQENIRRFFSSKRPREDDTEDQPEAKRDSSPFTDFPDTPSRKTHHKYDFRILRKPQPSPKRSPKANRQSSRRAERKSLDEIPEEDEADESADELDTL